MNDKSKEVTLDAFGNPCTTFESGAIRSSKEGKGRFDLLPANAIFALARLIERGAKQYGDRNWERGIPISSFIDSGLRHAFQASRGDTDEEHLINAAWNFLCAYETKQTRKEQTTL